MLHDCSCYSQLALCGCVCADSCYASCELQVRRKVVLRINALCVSFKSSCWQPTGISLESDFLWPMCRTSDVTLSVVASVATNLEIPALLPSSKEQPVQVSFTDFCSQLTRDSSRTSFSHRAVDHASFCLFWNIGLNLSPETDFAETRSKLVVLFWLKVAQRSFELSATRNYSIWCCVMLATVSVCTQRVNKLQFYLPES